MKEMNAKHGNATGIVLVTHSHAQVGADARKRNNGKGKEIDLNVTRTLPWVYEKLTSDIDLNYMCVWVEKPFVSFLCVFEDTRKKNKRHFENGEI